jgi:hypothetical protein
MSSLGEIRVVRGLDKNFAQAKEKLRPNVLSGALGETLTTAA